MHEITIIVPNWFMNLVLVGILLSIFNTLVDIYKKYKK